MPVDFMILSGTRQGQQFRLRQLNITVGGESHCDILFDTNQDPEAAGKLARLVADEYGWCIRNDGLSDWFVNQDILPPAGALPLRSGDIIRLSELGPDLRFTIVSGEQFTVEEEPEPCDQPSDVGTAQADFRDESEQVVANNTYTVMVPLLVLALMLLVAIVGTLLVVAD